MRLSYSDLAMIIEHMLSEFEEARSIETVDELLDYLEELDESSDGHIEFVTRGR